MHLQQRAGHRRSQDSRERRRGHEDRGDGGALARGKPVAEIENDAREEPGLGGPQQEPQDVETVRSLHECHGAGDQAPGDHHPGDPDAGADLLQHEVRRHLEQEIAEEEDAGAETEHGGREPQLLVHGQRREADVDAVDEGYEVEQHHEGNDAQGDFAQHARLQLGTHRTGSSPDWSCLCCFWSARRPARQRPPCGRSRADSIGSRLYKKMI